MYTAKKNVAARLYHHTSANRNDPRDVSIEARKLILNLQVNNCSPLRRSLSSKTQSEKLHPFSALLLSQRKSKTTLDTCDDDVQVWNDVKLSTRCNTETTSQSSSSLLQDFSSTAYECLEHVKRHQSKDLRRLAELTLYYIPM